MAQSSLRQFYAVRKRPQEEHGSLKRRKLTEETRLDIPSLGEGAHPLSLPLTQPALVSTATGARTRPSVSNAQRSKTKTKGRGRSTRSQRRRKSPPLPATPSIILPSPPSTSQPPPPPDADGKQTDDLATSADTSTAKLPPLQSPTSESDKELPSLPEKTTDKSSSSTATKNSEAKPFSPVKRTEDGGRDGEDPLILPSPPKSHKQDTSSSTNRPSPSSKPHSSTSTLPPQRSRKNLAERMRLASRDPPTSSLSPSPATVPPSQPNLRRTPAKTTSKPSAKQLAQKTVPENTPSVAFVGPNIRTAAAKRASAKELAQKTVVERKSRAAGELAQREGEGGRRPGEVEGSAGGAPLSSTEAISRLYKLSARELAQKTEPERRTATAVRRSKGKSPAPPTPHAPQLHQFKSFVVLSPTKSPSKQPAYRRFHSLARTAGETPDLPLPYKYQVLLEKFRCTDTVVTMLQKRREICTFTKLKHAVEEMTRRKYENRNLAQMKTVYPRSFIFRQEKHIPGIYDHKTFESYQLTVECNVREDGRQGQGEGEEREKERVNEVLDSSALLRRRKVFNKNLCDITRRHHERFLSSLNPPLEIPDEKVLRWHPAFQLDSLPDVEEAPLPTPPLSESYTTAQDVLNAAQAQGRLAPRVQQALEGVAKSSKGGGAEPVREEGGGSSPLDPALRGVSQKLLEKIQKKEASRVKLDITRDPVKEKRLEMLTKMPQLTRIIRSLFVTEKKAAIPWDTVVQKLRDSHTSCLPADGAEELLGFMQESLGGWLRVVEVRKKRFVKINKNTDSQILTARMEDTRKKLLA